ncbi:hypothetical protein ASG54_03380 [Aureimonas sp. Leaf460]|nr:hypothetical protein ASG62_21415 [Aureimonas sp. Leaf427]KQT78093.1 hypothetical protein ASG54_03380 [Aureimonas sp. Leaf460]
MQHSASEFESLVERHLTSLSDSLVHYLAQDYRDDTMVVFRDILPIELRHAMEAEARALLQAEACRRELIIEQSGGTPRAYSSVGRDAIRTNGTYIPAFFDSEAILSFLSHIIGEPIYRVPYKPEEFIINSQSRAGDTHGWHWDDYAFALVWVVDEPDVLSGGRVEFVPRIHWDKEDTRSHLQRTLASEQIRSVHVPAGSCYLLRAKDALHRISPLTKETRRTVIVFTYATTDELSDQTISHESMESIYPTDTNVASSLEAA